MANPNQPRTQRLTTLQAAAFCGCSASMLEKLRVAGTGPVYLKLGRRVVYDASDLDAWLATRRRFSTSDPGAGRQQARDACEAR